jgi:hypothetical protein
LLAKDKERIQRHIGQWKHNRLLIAKIPASHPDWIVTVAFYTAVQAVDAALAFEDAPAWNHDTRFAALASIHRLSALRGYYHPLYDLSRKVRYTADPNTWILPRDIDSKVIRSLLLPLEKSVEKILGRKLELPALNLSHLENVTT